MVTLLWSIIHSGNLVDVFVNTIPLLLTAASASNSGDTILIYEPQSEILEPPGGKFAMQKMIGGVGDNGRGDRSDTVSRLLSPTLPITPSPNQIFPWRPPVASWRSRNFALGLVEDEGVGGVAAVLVETPPADASSTTTRGVLRWPVRPRARVTSFTHRTVFIVTSPPSRVESWRRFHRPAPHRSCSRSGSTAPP